MEISVLDYAMIDEGETPEEALAHTVETAQLAEQLGYKRFWIAEHHEVTAFASSSPEMIAQQVVNHTNAIRVGSGGVMLPHYSPFKVAENFRVLEAYHPGRIDMGIGDNPGTKRTQEVMETHLELKAPNNDRLEQLLGYLTDQRRGGTIPAPPTIAGRPDVWKLSTSIEGAVRAGEMGISYCYGLFPYAQKHGIENGREALSTYREHFQPSEFQKEPHTMVGIFVSTAENQTLADQMTTALDWWLLGKDDFSYFERFPSIETAAAYQPSETERRKAADNRSRMAHGTFDQVHDELSHIVASVDADELILMPLMPGFERRKQALTALAERFHLNEN